MNDSVVSIFASSDVSVKLNVTIDSFVSIVVVYPTDTHGTEYQAFNLEYGTDYCSVVTTYDNVQTVVYNGKEITEINGTVESNYRSTLDTKSVFVSSPTGGTSLLYMFNKPSTMFCFNDNLTALYQPFPLNTWSTDYVPNITEFITSEIDLLNQTMLPLMSNYYANCSFTIKPITCLQKDLLRNMTIYHLTFNAATYKINISIVTDIEKDIWWNVDKDAGVPSYSFSALIADTKYYLLSGYTSLKRQVSVFIYYITE